MYNRVLFSELFPFSVLNLEQRTALVFPNTPHSLEAFIPCIVEQIVQKVEQKVFMAHSSL